MDSKSAFLDPDFAMTIFGVLVLRLGGEVTITQEDFDKIAFLRMEEQQLPDKLIFRIGAPKGSA
ncbi:MAG: hypothetical protein AB7U98_13720 [Candidatus Nitrosocosmicus sp.]